METGVKKEPNPEIQLTLDDKSDTVFSENMNGFK